MVPTDTQLERARSRLRLAGEVLRDAVSGLSQVESAIRLGVDRNVVSFWARALGVAPSRRAGIGAQRSYAKTHVP